MKPDDTYDTVAHDTVQDSLPTPDFEPTTFEPTTTSAADFQEDIRVEEFKISGNELVEKVKQILHEGNVRRVILKNEEGNTLLEIPLTVGIVGGVIGATMFPLVAALGAIGALVAHLTLVIEKKV